MSGIGRSDDQPPDGPRDKTRKRNSRAQKKYRERKQDEEKQLQQRADQLARDLVRITEERDRLLVEVSRLDLLLRGTAFKPSIQTQKHEPIYIPAVDGYGNLRCGERPGLMLRAVYSPPRRWTYAEMMELNARDINLIRKDITLMAGHLLLCNPTSNSSSLEGQNMKELMKESHGLTAYLAVFRQQLLYEIADSRLDDTDVQLLQRQLHLSEEQTMAWLSSYIQLRDTNRRLFSEREALLNSIVAHLEGSDQWPDISEGLHHSSEHFQWAKLVRRLQDNFDSSHIAKSKFSVRTSSLWTMEDMFGPDQKDAKMLTLSWPYFPRPMQCVSVLAQSHGIVQHLDAADAASTVQAINSEETAETPYKTASTKLLEEYMQHRLKLDS